MRTILVAVVDLYRACVRPFLPRACRFHPSCADYAAEAIRARGAVRGSLLAAGRLLRCHPFHPGGHDPVPAA